MLSLGELAHELELVVTVVALSVFRMLLTVRLMYSGGKDSFYSAQLCQKHGHEVRVNLTHALMPCSAKAACPPGCQVVCKYSQSSAGRC